MITKMGQQRKLTVTHGDDRWVKYYECLLKQGRTTISHTNIGPRRARRIALMMIEFGGVGTGHKVK